MPKKEMPLSGMRCLILDDEFLIALDIQTILEAAGARSVICVTTAEDALAALRDGATFDIAVLDFNLGSASPTSEDVAGALTRQRTPLIFLTGLPSKDVRLGKFPDVPVVEKPYQASSLLTTITQALANG